MDGDRLVGLRLRDGGSSSSATRSSSPPGPRCAGYLEPLGLRPEPVESAGVLLGSVLRVDELGATAVRGVHAAGNVTDVTATLIASAAHGMRVGAALNADLAAEDADQAVAGYRAELLEVPAWEQRYSGERVWSGQVNVQLAAEVTDLLPGRALDVGCGEGGDAVWLAEQGWRVTAADFAPAALSRTAQAAAERGVGPTRVETRQVDVRDFDAAGEEWDLVTSQFVHPADGGMLDVTRRLARAVAPGGTLLVIRRHPADPRTGLRHGQRQASWSLPRTCCLRSTVSSGRWRCASRGHAPRPTRRPGSRSRSRTP